MMERLGNLLAIQNVDGSRLVGQRIQLGPFYGTIVGYNRFNDSFECVFDTQVGNKFPVARGTVLSMLVNDPSHLRLETELENQMKSRLAMQLQLRLHLDSIIQKQMILQAQESMYLNSNNNNNNNNNNVGCTAVYPESAISQIPFNKITPVPKSQMFYSTSSLPVSPSSSSSSSSRKRKSSVSSESSDKGVMTNTKTQVFKKIHACYKRDQDIHSTPLYQDIENSLDSCTNINASRISTLRSRYLMSQTLKDIEKYISWPSWVYAVNCISSACPLCGRSIALNKLASYENWCKHLDLHGKLGKQIAIRFRHFDKNLPDPPNLDPELVKQAKWVKIESRNDSAPLETDLQKVSTSLIPLSNKYRWQALMFSQLLFEEALLTESLVCQEITVLGLKWLEIPFSPKTHFKQLYQFQEKLKGSSQRAFNVYIGANTEMKSNSDVICGNHCSILDEEIKEEVEEKNENNDNNKESFFRYSLISPTSQLAEEPKNLSMSPRDLKVIKSSMMNKIFTIMKQIYSNSEEPTCTNIENTLAKSLGNQSINIIQIITLRRRHIVQQILDGGFENIIINPYISICPFCHEKIACEKIELDQNNWLEHIQQCDNTTQQNQIKFVQMYNKVVQNETFSKNQKIKIKMPFNFKRKDLFQTEDRIDWRAKLFHLLLENEILKPSSVLTQEIVVLGLFYFGLVNQRSPQKFGQYPQLQSFQQALHSKSIHAYDVYCGVGIKENEIGSSHTRGKPINVTKLIIRKYHHYGLSHKSLKRNNIIDQATKRLKT